MTEKKKSRLTTIQKQMGVPFKGAKNAFELIRKGRLCAPYRTPHRICHQDSRYRLRRYLSEESVLKDDAPALVLIPPLMLTAEVYDMSPELSAVRFLMSRGVDVWVVDFGSPEEIRGAMTRTLDDHVLAIDHAVDYIRGYLGREVHLAGYSQGGMFAYQAAAYRKSQGVLSIITFGSPVNWYRNLLPRVLDPISERVVGIAAKVAVKPFERIGGVPAALSSNVFKIIAGRKSVQNLIHFFTTLHDRETLEKIEQSRRFMAGEGFVAWPGPALVKFINDLVVQNRLMLGGLVINGKSVSLSDLTCPIYYFVGKTDNFGRPAGVRAIRSAAPNARLYETELDCGHFGMVMGSKAFGFTWPTVAQWVHWIENKAKKPNLKPKKERRTRGHSENRLVVDVLYNMATDTLDNMWAWLGDAGSEAVQVIDMLRWQLPRLAQVKQLNKDIEISIAKALDDQAGAIRDATCFLWKGNSYTYAQVNRRVNQMAVALRSCRVKVREYVGIFMDNHPEYVITAIALNRMRAVPVLIPSELTGELLQHVITAGKIKKLIIDPDHLEAASGMAGILPILVTGSIQDPLPDNCINLKTRMPKEDKLLPQNIRPNTAMASDLAMILFTAGTTGLPKPVKISNRRWCATALVIAAGAQITSRDTVFLTTPLYHGTGILAAAGSAMVAGARLALSNRFSVNTFWNDIRRYGATICFYVGQMCRYLVQAPRSPHDKNHPVRLFIGTGMRKEVWERFQNRFGIDKIMECYTMTEGTVMLLNIKNKVGSVGHPIGDPNRLRLVRYDITRQQIRKDKLGRPMLCDYGEPGLLLTRMDKKRPVDNFEGYLNRRDTNRKLMRSLFEPKDCWFTTGDLLSQDADGDYRFVGRLADEHCWPEGSASCEFVDAALFDLPFIANTATYGVTISNGKKSFSVVAIELKPGQRFNGRKMYQAVCKNLTPGKRPRVVRVVHQIPATTTMKFQKYALQLEGVDPSRIGDALYYYNPRRKTYSVFRPDDYPGRLLHFLEKQP